IASVPGHQGQARVTDMRALIAYNRKTNYQPRFGTLASITHHGGCANALGPGAGLALADGSGAVAGYSSSLPPPKPPSVLSIPFELSCPMNVIDLGNLPPTSARPSLVADADAQVARIVNAAPSGAVIVLAGVGDDGSPHLRVIIVAGPGYHDGLLTSAATRQPGIVMVTDLTPSIFGWRAQPVPAGLVGSQITSSPRG